MPSAGAVRNRAASRGSIKHHDETTSHRPAPAAAVSSCPLSSPERVMSRRPQHCYPVRKTPHLQPRRHGRAGLSHILLRSSDALYLQLNFRPSAMPTFR